LIYRGLPQADIVLDPLPSAVIAFTWSIGSYATEMIRSSIQAVPDGQTDAARALNLPDRVAFFSVILPQALRIAIPPLMNLAIKTFQLTSLGYAITLSEVMQAAHRHGSVHFKFLESFVVAAVIYAAVIIPCSVLARRLERRLSLHLRPVQGVNATTQ